ncbi:MAG TPA: glucose 1-dehydrogenase [Terriglobales bacterium]
MKAITVEPKKRDTTRLEDVPEPDDRNGSVLVEAIAVGVCGTDVEIATGKYGWAPPGKTRLVLGHESLGRVIEPDPAGRMKKGELVVGIVRRPDPVPCPNCAVGEWDMCRNGQYTERGIKQIDGYMSQHWRIEPDYAIKIDPSLGLLGVLLEPTTVVAKAWEEVDRIGSRSFWEPRTALITGAGPIGLLAALLGKQRGLDVHVLDRVESGTKPDLVRAMGATYHSGSIPNIGFEPDVVIECTGVGPVINDSIQQVGPGGIVCLTGVGAGGPASNQITADVATDAVLKNKVVVGSVNANKRHWFKGGEALARADRDWLSKLISRREKPENFAHALERKPDDIKVVIQFAEA